MRFWLAFFLLAACTGGSSLLTDTDAGGSLDAGPSEPILVVDAGPECPGDASCAPGSHCVDLSVVGVGRRCLDNSVGGNGNDCAAIRCPASRPACGEYATFPGQVFCVEETTKEAGR